MGKRLAGVIGGTIFAIALGAGGAVAQDGGQWNSKAVLVVIGTKAVTLEDQPGHMIAITEFDGAAFNSDGKPFLDKARYQVTDITDTAGQEIGYKTFTEPDGSKVYARYLLKEKKKDGAQTVWNGTWEFTGGTGKYRGITGRGSYHVVSVSDTAVWDELTGEYKVAPSQ
ncbi:hypothetical protein [Azospirillum canadense]|uniref:hypothetical protein n=1 Tax=Azospirillum canadense TaxID=403962 RepID=UPI00222654C1|nr:hypothetical protein [Azospirillum canadense]MCW2239086.1 hypothetical protein [Azospirillum canadense]MCW2241776.1 hypothetical protein [Azospirillum canadense]